MSLFLSGAPSLFDDDPPILLELGSTVLPPNHPRPGLSFSAHAPCAERFLKGIFPLKKGCSVVSSMRMYNAYVRIVVRGVLGGIF